MILLTPEKHSALKSILISVADDEWIMGHRGSEWLAEAPDLEDDLALSSTSQDEMGHARLLYRLIEELGGPSPDHQVYARPVDDWYPARLVTLARQDWAEWVTRRYFYEVFDAIRRHALISIPFPSLAYALQSIEREEAYHIRYIEAQMTNLAYGGQVAHDYLAHGIAVDWAFIPSLFSWGTAEETWQILQCPALDPRSLQQAFEASIQKQFATWDLAWPGPLGSIDGNGRSAAKNPDLAQIRAELRAVRQIAPDSHW